MNGAVPPVPPAPAHSPLPWRVRLQYFYLLRIPILLAIILLALPFVALFWARPLLGNLLVVGLWGIFWTTMAAMMLAWGILVTFRVVQLNGRERFGIRQWLTEDKVSTRALILSESLIVPVLLACVFSNGQARTWEAALARLGSGLAGVVAAHIIGYLGLLAAILISPRYKIPAGDRFPMPFRFMKDWLNAAYNKEFPNARARLAEFGRGLGTPFAAGYVDPRTKLPYPGQLLSILLLICAFALYLLTRWWGRQMGVSAITYLVLLLILLNWILSIVAFFLDRYRFPLLFFLLVVTVLGNWIGNWTGQADHYFEITQRKTVLPVDPGKTLTARARVSPDADHPRGRVTIVATAGGGIQAAAWTAQVLTGLERQFRTSGPDKPVPFADSIALISGVSGGAAGTLFFANGYADDPAHPGFTVPDNKLDDIVAAAEKPSLDDIAWAIVNADFWRIFAPYFKLRGNRLIDRGQALEEGWRTRENIQATLADWREGVEQGRRPSVIFNATLAESGEPLLLATTDIRRSQVSGLAQRTFSELYSNSDLRLVTAVRLAATYPFVTPASRALDSTTEYHVVDGGYYDNYGVSSALEWLRDGLSSIPVDRTPDILIIQIRSFPSGGPPKGKGEGWFYQTWAPLTALMSVRTAGQLVRDRDALASFAEQQAARGVHVSVATFEFQGSEAPFSWKMNDDQIKAIRDQWQQRLYGTNNQDWLQVSCFFRPHSTDCAALAQTGKKGAW